MESSVRFQIGFWETRVLGEGRKFGRITLKVCGIHL